MSFLSSTTNLYSTASSTTTTSLLLHGNTTSLLPSHISPPSIFSVSPSSLSEKDKGLHFDIRPGCCSAISRSRIQDYADVFQNELSKWSDHDIMDHVDLQQKFPNEIKVGVEEIKSMLRSMEDGEISISAYDTAWVALIEDINGDKTPQFPSSLQWIINNQLLDGSWGDSLIFSAHDRLLNTLACVVALKFWNIHPEKCQKGMTFFVENINKLENENDEHMPIGFEIAFPSLIEVAGSLNIEIPNHPVLQNIYNKRNLKLQKIPKEILHKVPTTLLHSLEGMADLDWEKLLKLKSCDGSFLFSPSSTAYAVIKTKDQNSLEYLNKIVQKFNGGVPNVYPVDLFEHIWVVDRLQRLGISRHFQSEIKECVDYVHRYWTEKGICWARKSSVQDIDDTAMGFRILRLHGYEVSADVFKAFEKGGEFFCFPGQSNQAITGMYNLYRASQVMFPGEIILEDAKLFSSNFLREKQSLNQILDKWIITKDLPGEVGFALDIPYYASLPRVEARYYIDQYGGGDDVWIGKTLYRMPYVNNNNYLELAKVDYKNCQALHLMEWDSIQKWYRECELGNYGLSKNRLLVAYYMAAASIFEPERSKERIAWAKTSALMEAITSYFDYLDSLELRRNFVDDFLQSAKPPSYINGRKLGMKQTGETKRLVGTLVGTLNKISLDSLVDHGRDITHQLHHSWEKWLMRWQEGGDKEKEEEAGLLVQMINLSGLHWVSDDISSHPHYKQLSSLTNQVCNQLAHIHNQKAQDDWSNHANLNNKLVANTSLEVESEMQNIVELVLKKSSEDTISSDLKQTFLTVAKAFYYKAHCDPATVSFHVAKVLFQKIE